MPKGEHGGGFPPFNSHTFASQLIWLAFFFVLLYLLMAKWALPQVARVIDNRQKRIEDDIAEAGKLKTQSDEAVAAYEKALADARARAQAIANETREREAAAADVSRKALEAELNVKLAEGEKSNRRHQAGGHGECARHCRGRGRGHRRAVDRFDAEPPGGRRRGRRRAQGLEELAMLLEAEFWVALGFFAFLGLLGYLGVHRMIGKSLDERSARIKAELDEARKLKDEAAQLLADYRRKREEAEGEAQEIVAGAKAEAERLAIEAKAKVEEFVARRTKMAETKIAQAEAQALSDVRGAAADAAIAAAEKILGAEAKGKLAAELIAKGIDDVRKKLN